MSTKICTPLSNRLSVISDYLTRARPGAHKRTPLPLSAVAVAAIQMVVAAMPSVTHAAPTGAQSYESCSMISSEYLTITQLLDSGFTVPQLQETLPGISEGGKKRVTALAKEKADQGTEATLSRINAEFSRCAKQVYDRSGLPPEDSREQGFYRCAGENKVRYELFLAAKAGAEVDEVMPQVHQLHRPVAAALFELYESDGAREVLLQMADELKRCVNAARMF